MFIRDSPWCLCYLNITFTFTPLSSNCSIYHCCKTSSLISRSRSMWQSYLLSCAFGQLKMTRIFLMDDQLNHVLQELVLVEETTKLMTTKITSKYKIVSRLYFCITCDVLWPCPVTTYSNLYCLKFPHRMTSYRFYKRQPIPVYN